MSAWHWRFASRSHPCRCRGRGARPLQPVGPRGVVRVDCPPGRGIWHACKQRAVRGRPDPVGQQGRHRYPGRGLDAPRSQVGLHLPEYRGPYAVALGARLAGARGSAATRAPCTAQCSAASGACGSRAAGSTSARTHSPRRTRSTHRTGRTSRIRTYGTCWSSRCRKSGGAARRFASPRPAPASALASQYALVLTRPAEAKGDSSPRASSSVSAYSALW